MPPRLSNQNKHLFGWLICEPVCDCCRKCWTCSEWFYEPQSAACHFLLAEVLQSLFDTRRDELARPLTSPSRFLLAPPGSRKIRRAKERSGNVRPPLVRLHKTALVCTRRRYRKRTEDRNMFLFSPARRRFVFWCRLDQPDDRSYAAFLLRFISLDFELGPSFAS